MAGRPNPAHPPLPPVVPLHLPHNPVPRAPLPSPPTSLIDREREVAEIGALLLADDVRLVTLTGAGGVGKTRLAIKIGEELALADAFAAGVAFVPLAALSDPLLVAPTIFQALGGREIGEQVDVARLLLRLLDDRHLLLILDNFEHLAAAAPTVANLLGHAPRLKILVTSRAPLRLSGEHCRPVAPLSLPNLGPTPSPDDALAADAVRLFVHRGRGARADFALTNANAPAIAAICHRLDGLPLAIELAAARLSHLSPAAILDRLDRLDRPGPTHLPLLTGGPSDVPLRQRTMRNAIAWSDALLDDPARARFRRLAVFVGGFTIPAAAAVCQTDEWQILDGIADLIAAGLLREEGDGAGEPRYGMLQTIRQYGLERLAASGEEDAVRRRHADWCLAAADPAPPPADASDAVASPERLARLEPDHANLRAALAWLAQRGDGPALLRLAGALAPFWEERGRFAEGGHWLETALDAAAGNAPPADRLRAATGAGTMAWYRGDFALAALRHGEALALARQLADRGAEAFARNNLGAQAMELGDYPAATAHFAASLEIARAAADRRAILCAQHNLAQTDRLGGDPASAAHRLAETIALADQLGDQPLFAAGLIAAGHVQLDLGNTPAGAAFLRQSLDLPYVRSHDHHLIDALEGLGRVGAATGRAPIAATLLGAASALREAAATPRSPSDLAYFAPTFQQLDAALGADGLAATLATGRALPRAALLAEAATLAAPLPTPDPNPTPEPFPSPGPDPATRLGLTPREAEILRLLAAGHSNRELADRLFISPATVARHLANLYPKLGVDSRARATAHAHAHGLA